VWEAFTEARLPILEDMPGAKSLTVETGYRYSSYSLAFGNTNTYKAGLQWAPVRDVRVRGMYQRAVRAPNVQEVFLQPRVPLDWYDIKIKGVITTYGGNFIVDTCVQTGNPTFCSLVHRTQGTNSAADGSLWISPSGYVTDTTLNLGGQRARGVDMTSAYRVDFGGGGKLGFDLIANYTMKYETQPDPASPATYDCAGYYGATCGVAQPRWASKLRMTWNTPIRALDTWVAWRHKSGVTVDAASPN